ncbi:MAG: MarR family winged helix-turn-helix transcriptional regulator [Pseudolabrys sp.]
MKASPRAARDSARTQRLRLWIRLLRATRAIESDIRDKLRRSFATTLPQFDVMAALARKPDGMTMTELSRRLMVSNGNVTGIVDRLVAEKCVVRQSPAEDRRALRVRLTPKGDARFAAMAKEHEGWVDTLLGDLDGEELDRLIHQFDALAHRLRDGEQRP